MLEICDVPEAFDAFGTQRGRFEHPMETSSLSGVGPVRYSKSHEQNLASSIELLSPYHQFTRQSSNTQRSLCSSCRVDEG